MSHRVAVTGIGVVSSAGVGKEAFFKSCSEGRSGLKECTLFSTEKLSGGLFGEAGDALPPLPPPGENPNGESRAKALMRPAIEEMMRDSGLDRDAVASCGLDAQLCFGTLVTITDGIYGYAARGKPAGTLEHVCAYLPWILDFCGIEGGSYVSSAACASGTTAAGMAFDFIRNGLCRLCVVGGADPLTEPAAVGFHSLKSLSGGVCNPYDELRDGINIGEGAAFFTFERLEDALARGARVYCEILGYGLANEAYHITAPDPGGAAMVHAMKEALAGTEHNPSDTFHINGHGTGTAANDQAELKAIERVFGELGELGEFRKENVSVTSTKSIIGHCMGAAGALELAAAILAVRNGVYMPLPNLSRPIETGLHISSEGHKCGISLALSNSFAFAGHVASVLVGKFPRGE